MANIFDLTVDVILYMFRFLLIEDRIAFALSSERFRQFCVREEVFRKMDLSRRAISTAHRGEVNRFFKDRQLTQHIRELNISNLHVLNWQMDNEFEVFISICPHLEELHVLNCGLSLERLHRILMQAPRLTALSWSLWDFTEEDIEFIVKSIKSSEGIYFKNIKHLHLEILRLKSHIQVAKYLLLSGFRDLQKLEIYIWWSSEAYCTGRGFPFADDEIILGFPEPSAESELQLLHSLMVGGPLFAIYLNTDTKLSDFVSVLSRKSVSRKWKKFWILPTIGISREHWSLLLDSVQDDFQSVEAIAVNPGRSHNAVGELKTLFQRIGDNTVRSLHVYLPLGSNSIVEFCEPILRVGGHSLKCLRLSVLDQIHPEQNMSIHSLFSNCSNITELDLLYCNFEKDICEPLSELKHLVKVQLMQCAISSKHSKKTQVEILKANVLTFVENCKNITHLDVRGCGDCHAQFSCRLTDNDLLALSKLRNLKSLTLYNISSITEWAFLQNISENCKFLTTLRILVRWLNFNNSHIPILMESAKFLQHLAIDVYEPVLESEVFWNLLSHAKNLERLCIRCDYVGPLNVPVAVETLKSLPRLHVLHLHSPFDENVEVFYDQMIRMLEKKESDCRFSFEIVTGGGRNTWINRQTGYSLISNKALPLNEVELCDMTPILDIPRF